MIEPASGNLLDADVDALVNAVNTVGVMGRGIALQFKRRFPLNFDVYAKACAAGEVQPGRMLTVDLGADSRPRFIINFPTKRHWKHDSRIEDVELGLVALAGEVRRLDLRSIAVPALGCGAGGLEWRTVGPMIERALEPLTHVRVLLYAPADPPGERSRTA